MNYSKGICWIDDCRIPFVNEKDPSQQRYKSYRNVDNLYGGYGDTHYDYKEQQGRFPANILVSDDMLNDGVISNSKPRTTCNRRTNGELTFGFKSDSYSPTNDKGTNSRYYDIDKWFDKIIND